MEGIDDLELHEARNTDTDKGFSFLFIHTQSNRGGDVDPTGNTKVPIGQAGDGNAMCLASKRDVLVTSVALENSYLDYWSNVLQLSTAQRFVPANFDTDLLKSVIGCRKELVAFIRAKQSEGIVHKKLILSVFEADETDIELLKILQEAGLGDDLTSECNYDLLKLGNKDGFRELCHHHRITQLPGDTFNTVEAVESFVDAHHKRGNTVVIKAPRGIGGGGQIRLAARMLGDDTDPETSPWQDTVREWIKTEGAVEAEQFADFVESEHVVDVYIDPTDAHHTAVMFDQLVKNDDESQGMGYYGAKYPSTAPEVAKKTIMEQVERDVVPALASVGFRGPAGIDVLWNPLHFMELNMRTDAITYVKHLTDRVGRKLYGKEPGSIAFMSLVNLPYSGSLADMVAKHRNGALAKQEDGIFVLSSPNRQRWGFFDVVAISPHNRETAEKVMDRALAEIWGEEQANQFLKAVYKPHPQIEPFTEGPLPYLVTVPKAYYAKKNLSKKWPLILFLHGMDERGTDLMSIRDHGIPKVALEDPHFQFIGVAPQLPTDQTEWEVPKLVEILDTVEKSFSVDTDREYVTGMSMGGHGTWAMALAQPKRFAAIAPICGDAHDDIDHAADTIKHLPVWAFHGTHDTVVPFSNSEKMVQALSETGAEAVTLSPIPGGPHDVWTEVYSNAELYRWLLSLKRQE